LTNTTVGKTLNEALVPLRLESIVVDDQLVIRRAELIAPVPVTAPVKDLTGGGEQQTMDLAELLMAVVEPGTWSEDRGGGSITADAAKGSLSITHRRTVQFEVLLVLEKLRGARGIPHVLKLDPALFRLDSRATQAKAGLERPVALNFSQPTRLVTILDRLGDAAGVRMLVDWRDVASAGWNPAGESSLVVSSQPLSAALDLLLGPLDLTWRVIDHQTLQVVTPGRLAEQCEIELYKVGDLAGGDASAEALIVQIRTALGETTFSSDGGGEIRYEPDSRCLLAWLPQPKQRELEALIGKWRSEK
jgi:hypothetical protein